MPLLSGKNQTTHRRANSGAADPSLTEPALGGGPGTPFHFPAAYVFPPLHATALVSREA